VWVFDLDNTLYPADCNLFLQVDQRMGEFIARLLGVPFAYARHLQKTYYRQFGTTLSGLMQVHAIDPKAFLDYVHDIDLGPVREHPELAAVIDTLPGRKLIFTNGSRRHAERVAGKLGVLQCFESIFDICDANYVPKPEASCYDHFCRAHGVEASASAMFEDIPHNLKAPHALGMTTVLVRSNANHDHPLQQMIRAWAEPPEHVHHMTFDLAGFLEGVAGSRAQSRGSDESLPTPATGGQTRPPG
jgi:putative hydrolase of the HAD superfamily